jgi:hypothetical protein
MGMDVDKARKEGLSGQINDPSRRQLVCFRRIKEMAAFAHQNLPIPDKASI